MNATDPPPTRLLLVEDSPSDALILQRQLRRLGEPACTVTHVGTVAAACTQLATQPCDVVLLDLGLPDSAGLATYTVVAASAPATPIIILTGNTDTALALDAIRAGAQDYLLKDACEPALLGRAIRYAIERQRAQAELRRARDSLDRQVREQTAELRAVNDALRQEIAQRLRIEAALARREEQLRLIADNLPALIAYVDATECYRFNNEAYREWFGLAPEALTGRPVRDVLGDAAYGAIHERLASALAGQTVQFEAHVPYRHGGERTVAAVYVPHRDASHRVIGLVTLVQDIGARREMEEALRQKNRDLEMLLYVASHDLREPLRAIQSFATLVQRRYAAALDETGRDFLARIEGGGRRLEQLIDDILQLSRAQRQTRPGEVLPLAALVEAARKALEDSMRASGARLVVGGPFAHCRLDRVWATQAVYNLLANALKFHQPGQPPEIEVAPHHGEGGAGLVVRDRGPGFPPEQADRIFQLFQRAVGREIEGTGAGLAIVRQVAERHGGRAWATLRPGGGAEFFLTFGPPAPAPEPP